MSTVTVPFTAATAGSPPPLLSVAGFRRFTPEQYHKVHLTGFLQEGEPIELLEGYVVEKKMRNPPHDNGVTCVTDLLYKYLPAGWTRRIQCAVALGASEPEPDATVLRGVRQDYQGRLPTAGDVGIVIEVSDSSLDFDRRDKGRIYARAGIPVYWIVNVVDRHIEVYTTPDPAANPPEFTTSAIYLPGQGVPLVLDGVAVGAIPVSEFIA